MFSTTDFKNGFYNISMTDRAAKICSFADPTTGLLYEHCKMPMGLVGSPSSFAKLGALVFHEVISVCLQLYIDDLICYTTRQHVQEALKRKEEENDVTVITTKLGIHTLQLESIFQRCIVGGLICAIKKTHVAQEKVSLLGHLVSTKGLQPCPDKVEAMKLAPSPIDLKQVRRALGCFGFYRRFIPRYTEATVNIRKLLKKGVSFEWTDAMEKEYEDIKNILSSAPLVSSPDYSKDFYMMTDGSKVGLAGVVYQCNDDGETKIVLGYWSRACSSAEANYDARELETLAVIGCITKFRSILPAKFILYTDHLNLLKLQSYVSHKSRLANWSNRLSVYRPDIRHIAGNKNVVADWLSRAPVRPSNVPLIQCISEVVEGIDDVQVQDDDPSVQYHEIQLENLSFWISGEAEQRERWENLLIDLQDEEGENEHQEIFSISPVGGIETVVMTVAPSVSVRSKAAPPERVNMKRIKDSQVKDERFRRVLWYLDQGDPIRRNERKCERSLRRSHERYEQKRKEEPLSMEQKNNYLGQFKNLSDLRKFASPFDMDKEGY